MRATIVGLFFALSMIGPVEAADIRVDFKTVKVMDPDILAAIAFDPDRTHVVSIEPRSLDRLRKARRGDRIVLPVPGRSSLVMDVEHIGTSISGYTELRGTSDRLYESRSYITLHDHGISGMMFVDSIFRFTVPRGGEITVMTEHEWGEGENANDTLNPDSVKGTYPERGGDDGPYIVDIPFPASDE